MTTALAVVFGVGTALSNALAVMAQHVASTAGRRRGWGWLRDVLRHPLWLLGWIALGGSLVCQSVALHFGPLSLVQPLLVSELVIALAARRLWRRQRLSRRAWVSALLTSVALAGALRLSSPHGGVAPSSRAWTDGVLVTVVVVVILVLAARGGSPNRRAAAFATATAVLWAVEATFIKSATDALLQGGVAGLLRSWTLYALVVAGVGGLTTEQLALREGPLRVSQPLIVIVDPVVSVIYGIALFREHLSTSPATLALVGLCGVVVVGGVVVMTDAVPETLVPDPRASRRES